MQLLVEYLGPAPAALSSWDALGAKGQQRLTERFDRFGFTWGDGDVAWSYDKKAQVMQALALIPDAVLNEVSGITWERLVEQSSVTYPCRTEDDPGQPIVFTENFPTKTGLARH